MNANAEYLKAAEWVDEDDAPELDDAFFARADFYQADRLVQLGNKQVYSKATSPVARPKKVQYVFVYTSGRRKVITSPYRLVWQKPEKRIDWLFAH